MIKQWSLKLYDDFVGSGSGWGASVPVAAAVVVVLADCSGGADEVAGGCSGVVSGMTTREISLVCCFEVLL